jgi:hypothetical protein
MECGADSFVAHTRTRRPQNRSVLGVLAGEKPARNDMIDIEKLSDEELQELEERDAEIRAQHKARQKTQLILRPTLLSESSKPRSRQSSKPELRLLAQATEGN